MVMDFRQNNIFLLLLTFKLIIRIICRYLAYWKVYLVYRDRNLYLQQNAFNLHLGLESINSVKN